MFDNDKNGYMKRSYKASGEDMFHSALQHFLREGGHDIRVTKQEHMFYKKNMPYIVVYDGNHGKMSTLAGKIPAKHLAKFYKDQMEYFESLFDKQSEALHRFYVKTYEDMDFQHD